MLCGAVECSAVQCSIVYFICPDKYHCYIIHCTICFSEIVIDSFSQNGLTPLMLAAQKDCGQAVKALLEAGADIGAVD